MAGLYPDVPSWRIPWDKDGSVLYSQTTNYFDTPVAHPNSSNIKLNSDDDQYVDALAEGTYDTHYIILFPQPYNIYAMYLGSVPDQAGYQPRAVEASTDTTNGVDGTWFSVIPSPPNYTVTNPYYRTGITNCTALNVKGVRCVVGNLYTKRLRKWHLFGEIASGNPDRLEFWHPTSDVRLPPTWLDWAEVPRGSSGDRTFRLKNLSPTLTANTCTVSMEAITDTSPSVPGAHLVSYNGGAFGASASVSSLLPGGLSQPFTLRRTTPTNAILSLWSFRLKAIATSWS